MVKLRIGVFAFLIILFLIFSFYPTIFEIKMGNKLADPNREFVLEHNYYFPDFNLYLSKIRQGFEGHWTAQELFTSEIHKGSLIQEFYIVLGQLGRVLGVQPNESYQLCRLILSPLLLGIILTLSLYFFRSLKWQILSFLIIVISGSFPRIYESTPGNIAVGRYMEWWSNIDSLQRITFIPHILFGQVISFFLLYHLILNIKNLTIKRIIFYSTLGNLVGFVFPPSLITLNATIVLLAVFKVIKPLLRSGKIFKSDLINVKCLMLFIVCSLPSLLYFFIITKQVPWSTLIISHKLHPMLIPLDQYILGLGPVFFLGSAGTILSIMKRDIKFRPLILFIITNLGFASLFSIIREQSPLRFTQTGLFIPLGILGTYFLKEIWEKTRNPKPETQNLSVALLLKFCFMLFVICYLFINLLIMKTSFDWQINWITQKINANVPLVPYPPQSMYPLSDWMDGIRWLKINTKSDDVVLAEVTASNYIPAYSGNTVYFGQLNTVNYEKKEIEAKNFLKGVLTVSEAENLLKNGRIKYIFYSVQEKETSKNLDLIKTYPFLKSVYNNQNVEIFRVS